MSNFNFRLEFLELETIDSVSSSYETFALTAENLDDAFLEAIKKAKEIKFPSTIGDGEILEGNKLIAYMWRTKNGWLMWGVNEVPPLEKVFRDLDMMMMLKKYSDYKLSYKSEPVIGQTYFHVRHTLEINFFDKKSVEYRQELGEELNKFLNRVIIGVNEIYDGLIEQKILEKPKPFNRVEFLKKREKEESKPVVKEESRDRNESDPDFR